MNRNLILVIEAIIAKEYAYKRICTLPGLNLKCQGVYCNNCLMNTAPIFIEDYPNLLIQVRDITNEQSINGNT